MNLENQVSSLELSKKLKDLELDIITPLCIINIWKGGKTLKNTRDYIK